MPHRPHGKLGILSERCRNVNLVGIQTDKVDHTWRDRKCLENLYETRGKQEGADLRR